MDSLPMVGYNPYLYMVLKNFQSAAMNSIRGPSQSSAGLMFDPTKMSVSDIEEYKKTAENYALAMKHSDVKPFYMDNLIRTHYANPLPFLFPLDATKSDKTETSLEGETIACFVVGGEKRLCLPQILNTLLKPYGMEQVYEICSELNIYFTRCNDQQLYTLKLCGILPGSAPSCGLITKTDASRLCHRLLHATIERSVVQETANSFFVFHGCFGKCKGLLIPELYIHPNAKCVKCCDCEGLFSLSTFVCHSHKSLEKRVCHWGFDAANWRSYLLLSKNQTHIRELEKSLEDVKAKFDQQNPYKRKEEKPDQEGEKKAKYDLEPGEIARHVTTPAASNIKTESRDDERPAFLQRGSPVILHPERVVPYTPSTSQALKTEPHNDIAPNVSLAPAVKPMTSSASSDDDVTGRDDVDVTSIFTSSSSSSALQKVHKPSKSSSKTSQSKCNEIDTDTTKSDDDGESATTTSKSVVAESLMTSESEDDVAANLNDSLEIDVSTTEENDSRSNNSDSGLSTPTNLWQTLLNPTSTGSSSHSSGCGLDRDRKLSILRRALAGSSALDDRSRDVLIQDFTQLCVRDEQQYEQLLGANKQLQQEVRLVRQELAEAQTQLLMLKVSSQSSHHDVTHADSDVISTASDVTQTDSDATHIGSVVTHTVGDNEVKPDVSREEESRDNTHASNSVAPSCSECSCEDTSCKCSSGDRNSSKDQAEPANNTQCSCKKSLQRSSKNAPIDDVDRTMDKIDSSSAAGKKDATVDNKSSAKLSVNEDTCKHSANKKCIQAKNRNRDCSPSLCSVNSGQGQTSKKSGDSKVKVKRVPINDIESKSGH